MFINRILSLAKLNMMVTNSNTPRALKLKISFRPPLHENKHRTQLGAVLPSTSKTPLPSCKVIRALKEKGGNKGGGKWFLVEPTFPLMPKLNKNKGKKRGPDIR